MALDRPAGMSISNTAVQDVHVCCKTVGAGGAGGVDETGGGGAGGSLSSASPGMLSGSATEGSLTAD